MQKEVAELRENTSREENECNMARFKEFGSEKLESTGGDDDKEEEVMRLMAAKVKDEWN